MRAAGGMGNLRSTESPVVVNLHRGYAGDSLMVKHRKSWCEAGWHNWEIVNLTAIIREQCRTCGKRRETLLHDTREEVTGDWENNIPQYSAGQKKRYKKCPGRAKKYGGKLLEQ